jgi:hypothetical protein
VHVGEAHGRRYTDPCAGVAELADAPDSKEIQKQIVKINLLKMQ